MTTFLLSHRWLIVAAVAMLGYLGPAALPSGAETGKPAATVTMDVVNFLPKRVTVKVGNTVEWRNTSSVAHTVTADPKKARDSKNVTLPKGARTFDSGNMDPGDTFTHAFSVAGTYKYVCIPHEVAGMIGEVIVKK